MSVYRPAKSPYFAYDFQINGQRFFGSTGLETKRDASRYEADLRKRILLGETSKPSITVDEACGLYWKDKGKHESASATTWGQLARLTAMLGGSSYLGSLEQTDLANFVSKRRGMKATNRKTLVSNATVNREVELARRVWKHAKDGYAVTDIEWGKLKLAEPKERVRELSADEETKLFKQLPGDLADVVEFAMLSGQRRTAVIQLLWSRLDLDLNRATVATKGGVQHTFPLTPRLLAIINRRPKVGPFVFTYVCERPAPRRKDRSDKPGRLKGERYPFSKQGWVRKWRKALKDAGIEDFRFHDLRHTAGSRIVRQSGNMKMGMQLLGHTNVSTTSRYVHVLEDDLRNAMSAAESRNSPGPEDSESEESNAKSTG